MATASEVKLSRAALGTFHVEDSGISDGTLARASELLQENHEKHHIFFNKDGFHNHIVHHLLTLVALGATPEEIQKAYDDNANYQRGKIETKKEVIDGMHDPEVFKSYLNKEKNYSNFLEFYRGEIDKHGWQEVLQKYVFNGSDMANDMLGRMFAGFLHSFIHLGFGVEFGQPAIIAEALAQASVHNDKLVAPLLDFEATAAKQTGAIPLPVTLIKEISDDEVVRTAAHWDDGNKLDGVLKRAYDQTKQIVVKYRVNPSDMDNALAEQINAVVYFTGAAQRADKVPKYDFYLMHSLNCSIFIPTFLNQNWLSSAQKQRILEWKGRADLLFYASRRAPPLLLDTITSYKPRKVAGDSNDDLAWDKVFKEANQIDDDGHAAKLIRAIANGRAVCLRYPSDNMPITAQMWIKLAQMAADSTQDGLDRYVRSAGFDEAWKDLPARASL